MEDRMMKQAVRRAFDAGLSGLEDDPRLAALVLAAVPRRRRARSRWPLRLAVALAVLLALTSTAFALARPEILRFLLGDGQASAPLEQAAQSFVASGEADGITARVTGVVYDGERLAFSYEIENDNPSQAALVAVEAVISLGGGSVLLDAPDNARLVPSPHLDTLPARRNPLPGGGIAGSIRAREGNGPISVLGDAVPCEITFIVYRPQRAFAVVIDADSPLAAPDAYTGEFRTEIDDALSALQGLANAEIVPGGDPDALAKAGYTAVSAGGELYGTVGDDSAHLVETARIPVRFTLDAAAFACEFAGLNVSLGDCTLYIERLRLSALETSVALCLIPTENTEAAARALAERYGAFSLSGDDGAPVAYTDMDHMASAAPDVAQVGGLWVCCYRAQLPGLLAFPQHIGICAGGRELTRLELMGE